MSDFDIAPPPVPGRKEGFLKRFLFKEEPQPSIDEIKRKLGLDEKPAETPAPPQTARAAPDLDEIKAKLSLDDFTPEPLPAAPAPPVEAAPKVVIHDWTSDDAHSAAKQDTPWTADAHAPASSETEWDTELDLSPEDLAAEELGTPAHHEAVDDHLAPLEKQQAKVEQALQETTERPQLSEWNLQEKEITPEQYFILRNGQPVKSLKELIDAIDYIDDTTFAHHVNEYRNDFSNWIRDVIGDEELADELQAAEAKPEMVKALLTHERSVAKQVQKEHAKTQQVVRKREQAVKKLEGIETQIDQLRRQLDQKSKELTGERKAKAKLIKDKLDTEVKRRLDVHKKALIAARQELAAAKKEYTAKTRDLQEQEHKLAEREKHLMLAEQRNKQTLEQVKEQRSEFAAEKKEAASLLKDAAQLRRQWEEMKRLDLQTKQNLEVISKREIEISRHEETLRQREKKLGLDLTKVHAEQERLAMLKEEHAKREAQAKALESDAQKMIADAETRTAEALETERTSRERIKADMKKLETLRKQIDTTLAKVLKNKQKISTAVALRKHLEESMTAMRSNVAQDRKQMEEDGYKSYMEAKTTTTPAGQPEASHTDDVLEVNKRQLPIYTKVEECRSALDRHDLQAAKRIYSELRNDYVHAKLPSSEKSVLYNSIRELYDDIHLAMLG